MGDANIGSLFRLADAFNIEKIIFTGTPVNMKSNRLKKTARATVNKVEFEFIENAEEAINLLKTQHYTVFGLEITSDSIPIDSFSFENEKSIALLVGNEQHGIDPSLLELTAIKLHITMFGHNSSMNVAQATGIALYEITKTLPSLQEK